ncbi:MAG TPA: cellulase family glycosylhydrolase [Bacteroidales bacterium]|nr:cellulase family glycosylhydrolase [Bacteroidales bacterium]
MSLKKQIFLALILVVQVSAAQTNSSQKYHAWWNDEFAGKLYVAPTDKVLPLIQVRGNKFINATGDTVLFRGVSISDPDKIDNQGYWNERLFVKLKEYGVKLVRIPVHPVAWRERTPEGYLHLLDQAVEWATLQGIYLIIDWHSIGNLKTELFQNPMYNTSLSETYEFWRTISRHFADNNTIAFYELFNEPTLYNNRLGTMSWDEWKKINEEMIAIIRGHDKRTIPMVAGFDWAYDLTPLHYAPINAEGICYVSHPYPHKRSKPYIPKWEEDFGFAASKYPVVATEIGFTLKDMKENIDYGKAILGYCEDRGISWVAWVFDPDWGPAMIDSWKDMKPTGNGKFFFDFMKSKK